MIHNNPTLAEAASIVLNTKAGMSLSPELNQITPVVDIKPFPRTVRRASATNATSGTVFTTPNDKDFYLLSAQLSTHKDATATSTQSNLNITVDGVLQQLLEITGLSLTAQSGQTSITIPYPGIKIDRNTAITVTNGTATANVRSAACIVGYAVETLRT